MDVMGVLVGALLMRRRVLRMDDVDRIGIIVKNGC